jgi:hypothetical protein
MADETAEQTENSKPWLFKPGQSGNPSGRPKGSVSITHYIRKALEECDDVRAKELADSLINNAINGNAGAIKEVLSRIDGPVVQKIEHNDVSLTDAERVERLATLAERARARGAGLSPGDDDPDTDA